MAKSPFQKKPPREQAGRDATLRYQYQFRYAAEACLEILEDRDTICVFCDYQDDYVVHRRTCEENRFEFVQVKTKDKDPAYKWTLREVFGVNEKKKTPKSAPAKSFAGKLFFHELAFEKSCEKLVILSNVFFIDDIDSLLQAVRNGSCVGDLIGEHKGLFDRISAAYCGSYKNIDPNAVFSFLKKLSLRPNAGQLHDGQHDHSALFLKRIYEYSEISLKIPEAMRIYKAIIEKVREKSMDEVPIDLTEKELQEKAGVTLADLLSILSISRRGYEILKQGGDAKALRSTSRLHDFFQRRSGTEVLIERACAAKVNWDNWLREHRHLFSSDIDRIALESRCHTLIAKRPADFDELGTELDAIAKTYSDKLRVSLDKDLVFGLLLSLYIQGDL